MREDKFLKYKKRSRWFLLGGIMLVFISPVVMTQPAVLHWLAGKSDIGTTIGGITAPLVSLMGAILVYLSFEQQIEANQIQREALNIQITQNQIKNEYDSLEKQLLEIRDEFYNLKYKRIFQLSQVNHPQKGKHYKGEEALEAYSDDVKEFGEPVHIDMMEFEYGIKYLILLIMTLDEQLERSIIPKDQKNYLSKKFLYFFEAKMRLQVELINKNTEAAGDEGDNFMHIKDETTAMILHVNEMYNKYGVERRKF